MTVWAWSMTDTPDGRARHWEHGRRATRSHTRRTPEPSDCGVNKRRHMALAERRKRIGFPSSA